MSDGDVFVADQDEHFNIAAIDVFSEDIVVPDVATEPASALGPSTATLNGVVNPDNVGEASCRFVWGETEAFGHEAPCEPEHLTNGNTPVAVHAEVTGLDPDSTYFFRLQASNASGENPSEPNQDRSFRTLGVGVHGQWSSDVAATSANVNAQIDPNASSHHLRHPILQTKHSRLPAGSRRLHGGGLPALTGESRRDPRRKGDVQVQRHLQGLTPGTTYHYRVLAFSELVAEGKPATLAFPGADENSTTQGAGTGFALLDNRQWELVSPPDKRGALLQPIALVGIVQASESGNATTYLADTPTEAAARGQYEGVQVLSERGPAGWRSKDIVLPHSSAVGAQGKGYEYRFFSEDLAAALVEPQGEFTSLFPEAFPADTEATSYLRHDATCTASPTTCFEPLATGAEGAADVPSGTKFGGATDFLAATPDLKHVILKSKVPLTAAPTGGNMAMYEWSAEAPPTERMQLIMVAEPGEGEPALGYQSWVARGAVSADGSRVIFVPSENRRTLYMRDLRLGKTLQLDLPHGGSGTGQPTAIFQSATSDGSHVLFTDAQPLTADAGATTGHPDLYRCDIVEAAGELHCELTDLTPKTGSGVPADVQGWVPGTSSDGSWVYFVANGVLAEHAVLGSCANEKSAPEATCNLYVVHGGVTRLVAILSGDDFNDWKGELGVGSMIHDRPRHRCRRPYRLHVGSLPNRL